MKILTASEVKTKIRKNPQVKLVMTLGPQAFHKNHIPGSLNIWNLQEALQLFSKDTEIIVYCSDTGCLASYHAYHQLEKAGYQNIWRFPGGLVEWFNAGYPLSSSQEN